MSQTHTITCKGHNPTHVKDTIQYILRIQTNTCQGHTQSHVKDTILRMQCPRHSPDSRTERKKCNRSDLRIFRRSVSLMSVSALYVHFLYTPILWSDRKYFDPMKYVFKQDRMSNRVQEIFTNTAHVKDTIQLMSRTQTTTCQGHIPSHVKDTILHRSKTQSIKFQEHNSKNIKEKNHQNVKDKIPKSSRTKSTHVKDTFQDMSKTQSNIS